MDDDTGALMDFSNMFKRNRARPSTAKQAEQQQPLTENVVTNVVPRNLTITQDEMKLRRCLDIRRWYCLSRPQYQRTCGISSVVTVWNYLFSTLGVGTQQPISQEDAIVTLSLAKEVGPHFNDVEFGSFSGNLALITWFKNLCRLRKVKGRAYYLWKVWGKNNTPGIDRQVALQKLKQGLQGDRCAYVYHAYDHYFCPVGYEITPNRGFEAYQSQENINMETAETWIIVAEPAKPHPFFTVRKWKDIAYDIELEYPKYVNIRKPDEGERTYNNAQPDGNSMHCILAFERVDPLKKKQHEVKQNEQPIEPNEQPSDEANEQPNEQVNEYSTEQQNEQPNQGVTFNQFMTTTTTTTLTTTIEFSSYGQQESTTQVQEVVQELLEKVTLDDVTSCYNILDS